MKRLFLVACIAAGALAGPAAAANSYVKGFLQIRNAWIRATPPGADVTAAYLEIRNTGKERDRLVAASSPAAERVEMHVMAHEGGVMKMREVQSLDVPARKQLVLRPGGPHLMIIGPRNVFAKGQRIPLVLRFERGGDVQVHLEVRAAGATKPHH
jgi:copper(I)-binding protein